MAPPKVKISKARWVRCRLRTEEPSTNFGRRAAVSTYGTAVPKTASWRATPNSPTVASGAKSDSNTTSTCTATLLSTWLMPRGAALRISSEICWRPDRKLARIFGLFNATLTALGLQGLIQDWLGDRNVALYAMFIASVWQTVGFSLVLFLAGLQNVSQTLIEASRIDGAGRFQVFRYVTLPALRPSITIVLILSIINSLKAFDIVYGMTGGGPAQSTQMLALWAFTQAMQLGDFGRGAAISVVLLLITIAIVVPYLRWSRTQREAGS